MLILAGDYTFKKSPKRGILKRKDSLSKMVRDSPPSEVQKSLKPKNSFYLGGKLSTCIPFMYISGIIKIMLLFVFRLGLFQVRVPSIILAGCFDNRLGLRKINLLDKLKAI